MSSPLIEHGPLVVFLTFTVVGLAIGLGRFSFPQIESFSSMKKRLLGLFIVELGGLLTSAWTLMIHFQLSTGPSNLCAAEGVVQCGSVIGDLTYSTDPITGQPWGVIGMLAFALLGWFTLSMLLDMKADWSQKYVDYAWWISLPSIPGILWLVFVELVLVDGAPHICPYCTAVHIALIATMYLLYTIRKERDMGNWDTAGPKRSKAELLAEARGKKK
tara:strand:- start:140 stop:790 length:651 start_codon:yes stop_codon:yes gene_type:complete